MSYVDVPYYKCNGCFKTIRAIDWQGSGWDQASYDEHYCPKCQEEY